MLPTTGLDCLSIDRVTSKCNLSGAYDGRRPGGIISSMTDVPFLPMLWCAWCAPPAPATTVVKLVILVTATYRLVDAVPDLIWPVKQLVVEVFVFAEPKRYPISRQVTMHTIIPKRLYFDVVIPSRFFSPPEPRLEPKMGNDIE